MPNLRRFSALEHYPSPTRQLPQDHPQNPQKAKLRRRLGSSVIEMPVLGPGERYREIALRDGRKAIVRAPDWHDLDDSLRFINELVEEHAEILVAVKATRNEEAEWLGKRLAAIEKGSLLALVAEIDGRMVASSDIGRLAPENPEQNHVGVLGIAISQNARGIGLGRTLIESLLQLAKQVGLKIIILDMFATNTAARRLYEKVGFREVGKIPKAVHRDAKYIDMIRFAMEI